MAKSGGRRSDHYSRKARQSGFPARSVFKLEEIDKRCALLRPGLSVLDLGAAPGSWLLYAATQVGAQGRVWGVDLQRLTQPLPAHVHFLQADVYDDMALQPVWQATPFDVVLSDMAPATSGHRDTDHLRSAALVNRVQALAAQHLKSGGDLVAKFFDGAEFVAVRQSLRATFEQVRIVKPRSTRSESRELFFVAQGKRDPATPLS
ncbi:MAG: RlmE family RNA methyltransferase [Polyangiales bacterium]